MAASTRRWRVGRFARPTRYARFGSGNRDPNLGFSSDGLWGGALGWKSARDQ
jgi:hypothetical protein